MLPIESIVRGYLSGSAWASYQKDGTVCGIKLRDGLQESQKLDHPIWTPSTKAPAGEHDINIGPDQAAEILGEEIAAQVEQLSLQIYQVASDYARSKGIIIADTKLEFGLQESTVVLADEVLTPDSSRFWSLDKYEVGKPQQSIDKQVVRDWLLEHDLQGKEGVELPDDIVAMTRLRYKEAFRLLTEREWED